MLPPRSAPSWMEMRDENVGWALFAEGHSSAILGRTADGAVTWARTSVTVPCDPGDDDCVTWMAVAFPGAHSAVFAVEVAANTQRTVLIDRTNDAGRTWQKASFDAGEVLGIESLDFSSAREGRLTLSRSLGMSTPRGIGLDQLDTFLTHDGGVTWRKAPSPASHWRDAISSDASHHMVFVASPSTPAWWTYTDCSTCSRILMHRDRPFPMPAAPIHCKATYAPDAASGATNMVVLQDGVATDGGWFVAKCFDGDWSVVNGTTPTALFVRDRDRWRFASIASENESFLSVRPGVFWRASGSAIAESRDDGEHWGPAHVPADLRAANLVPRSSEAVVVRFVSDRVGFALLPGRWLYHTVDGGLSWTRL
jgi:hypothetical protein